MALGRGGATRFGSMAGFMGHRQGSGGGEFLKKWKEAGKYDSVMHRDVLPMAIWRHQIFMLVPLKDKTTKKNVVHVWSKNLVCHEGEEVLENQYFYEKDDPTKRQVPPKRCGICKLLEWCYQQCLLFEEFREENEAAIKAGKPKKVKGIRFTTPMFRYEGDKPDENKTIYIGGFRNLWKKADSDAQKEDVAAAKITVGGPHGAWNQNAMAKCQYAMCVCDYNNPDSGIQIAVESSSLGDAVKGVLNEMVESDERNYETDPYVIRWKFDKNKDMAEMYSAVPMRKLKLTPRHMKLIRGPVPEQALDKLAERFNQQVVRASLESHCLEPIKSMVPWDELFPSEEQEKKWAAEDKAAAEEEEAEAEALAVKTEREPGDDTDAIDADAGGDDDDEDEDEEVFECDNDECKAPVKASDKKCAKCGHKYDVADDDEEDEEDEEEEEKPAPKPALKSRAEVLASKKAKEEAARAKSAPKKTSAKPKVEEDDDDDSQEDSIPF